MIADPESGEMWDTILDLASIPEPIPPSKDDLPGFRMCIDEMVSKLTTRSEATFNAKTATEDAEKVLKENATPPTSPDAKKSKRRRTPKNLSGAKSIPIKGAKFTAKKSVKAIDMISVNAKKQTTKSKVQLSSKQHRVKPMKKTSGSNKYTSNCSDRADSPTERQNSQPVDNDVEILDYNDVSMSTGYMGGCSPVTNHNSLPTRDTFYAPTQRNSLNLPQSDILNQQSGFMNYSINDRQHQESINASNDYSLGTRRPPPCFHQGNYHHGYTPPSTPMYPAHWRQHSTPRNTMTSAVANYHMAHATAQMFAAAAAADASAAMANSFPYW